MSMLILLSVNRKLNNVTVHSRNVEEKERGRKREKERSRQKCRGGRGRGRVEEREEELKAEGKQERFRLGSWNEPVLSPDR
jgi:hypothetical protein